ncbi:hypothetical protein Daus18300_002269 [Diaporthe australafricana]|uniref:BTB domain-containing protein n=1 Tax=Diaporthe australafricana TaxID=127596 RepID=A0ABR3XQB3_9PEZI
MPPPDDDQTDHTSESQLEQSDIKIDPDGDLTLVVGKTKTRFLVCSKTLSRSAEFWKRCLYGQFKEAKPAAGQDWVVQFPEDNPTGLHCLLLLVHGLGHTMPEISLQLAFEITIITNKYDMTQVLWAVARSWLQGLQPCRLDEEDDDTLIPQLQWLWVTKELGDHRKHLASFTQLSQMVSTTSDGQGHLLLRPYQPGDTKTLMRSNLKCYDAEKDVMLLLADGIKTARQQGLRAIQDALKKDTKHLRDAIRKFDFSTGCEGASICKGAQTDGGRLLSKEKRLCEYAMQAIVAKASDGPDSVLKPVSRIGMSVENFLASAVCFISRIEKEVAFLSGKKHKNCTPFTGNLPTQRTLMEMVSLDWTLGNFDAFKKQAQISGLEKGDCEGDVDFAVPLALLKRPKFSIPDVALVVDAQWPDVEIDIPFSIPGWKPKESHGYCADTGMIFSVEGNEDDFIYEDATL